MGNPYFATGNQPEVIISIVSLIGIGAFCVGFFAWMRQEGGSELYKGVPVFGISIQWFVYFSFYLYAVVTGSIPARFFQLWQSAIFIQSIYLAALIVWDLATGFFSVRIPALISSIFARFFRVE